MLRHGLGRAGEILEEPRVPQSPRLRVVAAQPVAKVHSHHVVRAEPRGMRRGLLRQEVCLAEKLHGPRPLRVGHLREQVVPPRDERGAAQRAHGLLFHRAVAERQQPQHRQALARAEHLLVVLHDLLGRIACRARLHHLAPIAHVARVGVGQAASQERQGETVPSHLGGHFLQLVVRPHDSLVAEDLRPVLGLQVSQVDHPDGFRVTPRQVADVQAGRDDAERPVVGLLRGQVAQEHVQGQGVPFDPPVVGILKPLQPVQHQDRAGVLDVSGKLLAAVVQARRPGVMLGILIVEEGQRRFHEGGVGDHLAALLLLEERPGVEVPPGALGGVAQALQPGVDQRRLARTRRPHHDHDLHLPAAQGRIEPGQLTLAADHLAGDGHVADRAADRPGRAGHDRGTRPRRRSGRWIGQRERDLVDGRVQGPGHGRQDRGRCKPSVLRTV